MLGNANPWVFEELERRLKARQDEGRQALGAGCAGDFAAYRWAVGVIDGIEQAIMIAQDIRKESER